MSTPLSGVGINASVPAIYRLISPTVTVDATGGAVEVDGNSTFNTNVPLGQALAITQVDWFVSLKVSMAAGSQSDQVKGQLTEALARTKVAFSDQNYIDEYFEELVQTQATAVGFFDLNRQKALDRHILRYPWLTVATQLNLVHSNIPIIGNGLKFDMSCVLSYELVNLTMDLKNYLATRLQITGQA